MENARFASPHLSVQPSGDEIDCGKTCATTEKNGRRQQRKSGHSSWRLASKHRKTTLMKPSTKRTIARYSRSSDLSMDPRTPTALTKP